MAQFKTENYPTLTKVVAWPIQPLKEDIISKGESWRGVTRSLLQAIFVWLKITGSKCRTLSDVRITKRKLMYFNVAKCLISPIKHFAAILSDVYILRVTQNSSYSLQDALFSPNVTLSIIINNHTLVSSVLLRKYLYLFRCIFKLQSCFHSLVKWKIVFFQTCTCSGFAFCSSLTV